MQPARSHSFGEQDRSRLPYSDQSQQEQQHYDQSSRNVISPPPQYTSPPPQEPRSPVPLSHVQPYTSPYLRTSTDIPRESSPQRYTDRSPTPPPPPPPPHRSSPSRFSRSDSGRRSIGREGAPSIEDFGPPRSQAPSERHYPLSSHERRGPYPGYYSQGPFQRGPSPSPCMQRPGSRLHEHSFGSNAPLAAGAATPGSITPSTRSDPRSSRYSALSVLPDDHTPLEHPYRMSVLSHHDSPYHNSSHIFETTISQASINPRNIADDGDDDFAPNPRTYRSYSMQQRDGLNKPSVATSAGPIAAGTGLLGGILGRKAHDSTASGTYQPVNAQAEKSDWLSRDNRKRKRNGWLCGIGIGVVIVIAIIGGIVGGVMSTHAYKTGGGSINNAADDTAANGDLNSNSAEIKQLLNNPNLHKVFPGMDYTPWGVQYPLCETYPPSQNNVTRDVAVLSQLTNTIRLYGTDCNQTEMVLHAIDRLGLKNMKIWLGVWIDSNQTTTDRQISRLYKILRDTSDLSIFKGAIIGNEALYRAGATKDSSEEALIAILKQVRSNFTSLGYKLPIATSDLGDNWNGELVAVVDYVMSNIHPFFAGVSADQAAAWTWNFWQQKDIPLTASLPNVKQIIAETGWPSEGGSDCGVTGVACAAGQTGATASISGMNTFMNDWVCQALANGTEYFWFEAFDEPWKVQYNTPGQAWEDKWGLLDAGRNLKSGVKIPSCGGKTVS